MKALVQREDSLIKPRQSQNRISGFSTDSVLKALESRVRQLHYLDEFASGPVWYNSGTYLFLKVLEHCDCQADIGIGLRLFSLIAALSQRVASLK